MSEKPAKLELKTGGSQMVSSRGWVIHVLGRSRSMFPRHTFKPPASNMDEAGTSHLNTVQLRSSVTS